MKHKLWTRNHQPKSFGAMKSCNPLFSWIEMGSKDGIKLDLLSVIINSYIWQWSREMGNYRIVCYVAYDIFLWFIIRHWNDAKVSIVVNKGCVLFCYIRDFVSLVLNIALENQIYCYNYNYRFLIHPLFSITTLIIFVIKLVASITFKPVFA